MFTKCPNCSMVYSLSPTDLSAAGGYVRCGECDTTFNALKDLSDAPPAASGPATVDPGIVPAHEAQPDTSSEPPQISDDASQTVADDDNETVPPDSEQLLFGRAADLTDDLQTQSETEAEPADESDADAQAQAGDETDFVEAEPQDQLEITEAESETDSEAAEAETQAGAEKTKSEPEGETETAETEPVAKRESDPAAIPQDANTMPTEGDLEAMLAAELAAVDDHDDTISPATSATVTDDAHLDDQDALLDPTHPALRVVDFVDDVDAFEHQVDVLADDDPAVDVALIEPATETSDGADGTDETDNASEIEAVEEATDTTEADVTNESETSDTVDDDELEEFDVDLASMKPATDLNFVILSDESDLKSDNKALEDDTVDPQQPVELDELFSDEVDRSDIEVEFGGAADDWLDEDEGVDEDTSIASAESPAPEPEALQSHPHPAPFRDVLVDLETDEPPPADNLPDEPADESPDDPTDEPQVVANEPDDTALYESIEEDAAPTTFDADPLTDDDPRDRKDLMNYLRPGLKPWQKVAGSVLALALTALLAGQAVHHWRSELVLNEKYGDRVRDLYARFDRTIQPAVSYSDYSVARHAVAPREDDAQILQVRATVANRADDPRPLPHVRVTFYDRFGDESFVRTFPPGIYSAASPDDRIAAGGRTEVAVDVVNIDADGITNYLVEACAPLGNDQVSCSASSTGRRDNR